MNRLHNSRGDGPQPVEDEQLELYALNLLEDDELSRVERRLTADPAARERLRELRGVVALLAFDLEPVEASPGLKQRIMDAARADLATTPAVASPPTLGAVPPFEAPIALATERRQRRQPWTWTGWAVAAVLAVTLAGSLVWNQRLRDDAHGRPPTTTYAVSASGNAVGATGSVVVVGDTQTATSALLALTHLPALERGKVYQVWLIAGAPQANVTFTPDKSGNAEVAVPGNLSAFTMLAVTVEPVGGSLAPTSEPLIISQLAPPGT